MMRYSIEPRTRKYVKEFGFLSFSKKYKKQLLETGLNASEKVIHKAVEYIENRIADAEIKLSQAMIILRNKNLLKK